MNYFNPLMQRQGVPPMGYGPDRGLDGGMSHPFLRRPMHTGGGDPAYPMPGMQTGGPLPPQGYDSGGINPSGMYTGGNLPAQQRHGMPMGGNLPPMRLAQVGGMRREQGFPSRLGGLLR